MGRPLEFDTKEELDEAIKGYFDSITVTETTEGGQTYTKYVRPPTVTGLAYYLGVTRQTLLNYQNKDEFFDTVKRAKTRIEMYAEEELYRNKGSVQGVKFNLTNNFEGWSDKQKLDINSTTQDLTDMSKEEREKRRQELRDKLGEN